MHHEDPLERRGVSSVRGQGNPHGKMAMADNLWRECAAWLTRCKVIPADHKANWPDSEIRVLALTLRDGVLLCNLLTFLEPNCLDTRDFHRKPQMAQVSLCLCNLPPSKSTAQRTHPFWRCTATCPQFALFFGGTRWNRAANRCAVRSSASRVWVSIYVTSFRFLIAAALSRTRANVQFSPLCICTLR